MTEQIWVSELTQKLACAKGFFADFGPNVSDEESVERHYQILSKIWAGQTVPKEEMPSKFYRSTPPIFSEKLPIVFHTQYHFFQKEAADIFRQFDMGNGYFLPIELFQNDRRTPIDQEASVLCVGNARNTVEIEKTVNIQKKRGGIFRLPFEPEDNEVITNRVALEGPDFWADPRITGGVFFLSNRLAQALIRAGLKEDFALLATKTV